MAINYRASTIAMRVHRLRYLGLLCAFWAMATWVGVSAAGACTDYYVCAPQDPFRHTVTNSNFTNIYLYPNPNAMSWDQYMAQAQIQNQKNNPVPAFATLTVGAIDQFVTDLVNSSYFWSATQYHQIEPPRFLGHKNTVQQCVDPVVAYAKGHGNVLSREILADFVGCETANGGTKSDQVNIILSPEFYAQNDFTFSFPTGNVTIASPPIACMSGTGAFHTGQLNTANFTVIPTNCHINMNQITESISHEMVETISDPAGMGYVHIEGGGDQFLAIAGNPQVGNKMELGDICEDGGYKNGNGGAGSDGTAYVKLVDGFSVSRYWSNIDNSCQPHFIVTDELVIDHSSHKVGSGGGMTPKLTYNAPFQGAAIRAAAGRTVVQQLVFYSHTTDDNLCNASHLDVHVHLTNGKSIDFLWINHNSVQYANSSAGTIWDNNETHAINLPIPSGTVLNISEIAGFEVDMESGKCHGLITDGDDKWDEDTIVIAANMTVAPPTYTAQDQCQAAEKLAQSQNPKVTLDANDAKSFQVALKDPTVAQCEKTQLANATASLPALACTIAQTLPLDPVNSPKKAVAAALQQLDQNAGGQFYTTCYSPYIAKQDAALCANFCKNASNLKTCKFASAAECQNKCSATGAIGGRPAGCAIPLAKTPPIPPPSGRAPGPGPVGAAP